MRVPLIAGNWKMHKTVREATLLAQELQTLLKGIREREVVMCPPFTSLAAVGKVLSNASEPSIKLGAQDCCWEEKGAFTGAVSPAMLKDLGCHYVIIGHSERRGIFKETDDMVSKKVRAALEWGLLPILCAGETLPQREAGRTRDVVRTQVTAALQGLTNTEIERSVVAYEPVWAIGTGKADSPDEANSTIGFIRSLLGDLGGYDVSQKVRILYGGSVKPDNIDGFMQAPEIDGALVGGASLGAESFARIVRYQVRV